MTQSNRFSNESILAGQALAYDAPPMDDISLQDLAQEAAAGRRSAAWQLLHRIKENDSRTIAAIGMLDDDRLTHHLLEWIALGTWAGKPFVAPAYLHSPIARMHLHTFFLPKESIDSLRVERVLITALRDDQPALRQTAANILGILGKATAVPSLIKALNDPVYAVQFQVVKALGRIKRPAAIPALLSLLQHADEQLSSQIFTALAHIGPAAVPALIEMSKDSSPWLRWHSMRALGETNDLRALPVLVQALTDIDHSVAWAAAKGLNSFGRLSVGPVLHLLMSTEVTPWLVETASYVLNNQRDSRLDPYIEPVIQEMHEISFRIGTMLAAQKALKQLIADGLEEEYVIPR
jgi:HEAT repeats/PBS lyase HEAT-like repeat